MTFSSKVTPLESLAHDDSDKNESQLRFLNSRASFVLLSYHALFKMSGRTVLQSGTQHWCAARLVEILPRRLQRQPEGAVVRMKVQCVSVWAYMNLSRVRRQRRVSRMCFPRGCYVCDFLSSWRFGGSQDMDFAVTWLPERRPRKGNQQVAA